MPRFFNTIRQRLLRENRFTRYLIYAIGEIVLVVIGILIALQINNWNSRNNSYAQERIYLNAFLDDLHDCTNELERVIQKSSRVMRAADTLLIMLETPPDNIMELDLDHQLLMSFGYTRYMSVDGAINDVLGSGKLSLFQHTEIRRSISSWEAELKPIRGWEELNRANTEKYGEHLRVRADLYRVRPGELEGVTTKEDRVSIANDRAFKNQVASIRTSSKILQSKYKLEFERIQQLIKVVEEELESK